MKITLAFLLLGLSSYFDFTNGNPAGKRKMTEAEAFSYSRLYFCCLTKLNKWKSCHGCSDIEIYCLEKAILEDIILILNILAQDMQCSRRDLANRLKIGLRIDIVFNAMENYNVEHLWKHVRQVGLLEKFVHELSALLSPQLKECNLDLANLLGNLNSVLGGILGSTLTSVTGILGSLLGGAGGLLGGGAGGLLGGLTGSLTGTLKGATDLAAGLVKTATDVAGGVVKTATGVAGGVMKGATDVATGVVKAGVDTVGGVAGGRGGLFSGIGK